VNVRLQGPGLALQTSGNSDTQTVTVKSGEDATLTWPLTAKASGDIPLRATAWTTSGSPQYTDGIEKTLPVHPWGRKTFTAVAGVLDGSSATSSQHLLIDTHAVSDASRLVVRVTPSLSGALVGGLNYLVGYPYGCTEQTLSRFLPDLLVQRLQRQTGHTLLTGSVKSADLPNMVRNGLTRLRNFQHHDTGGWGWWEHDSDDPFMTAYVLYGLSIAKAEGYAVSADMWEKGKKAAAKLVASARLADRPFLLYALALAGDSDTVRREAPRLPLRKLAPDGLAYLVLLERQVGGNPTASGAYQELQRRARIDGSLVYWKNPDLYWNGSDRMDTALAVRAYLAANPGDDRVPLMLRWLMRSRTDDFFGSTRDTAWVLVAFCDYLTAHPQDAAPTGFVTVRVNDRQVENMDIGAYTNPDAGARAQDADRIVRVPASYLHTGANTLTVERTGGAGTGGVVFYTGTLTQNVAAPNGESLEPLAAPAQQAGLTIKREYLRVVPRKIGDDSFSLATEDTGNRFHSGDNVRVRLTITAPRDLEYILVEDAFPSSFEPTERGTADQEFDADSAWDWWFSNVDVRDDHIALFARRLPKGTHVYEYNLRAQTPGGSRALPTRLQGMYADDLHTETGDTKLEVGE